MREKQKEERGEGKKEGGRRKEEGGERERKEKIKRKRRKRERKMEGGKRSKFMYTYICPLNQYEKVFFCSFGRDVRASGHRILGHCGIALYAENESSEIEYQIFNLNFNLNLYSENSQKKEKKKRSFLKERERGGGKVFKKEYPHSPLRYHDLHDV